MIRNFLFHRVNPQRDKLWDPMSPELFEKCIAYISKKYKIMLFEELVVSPLLNSKNELATIMFDDGYKDNIEYALPILEKYNVKASFYIVTDSIDNNRPTWTHIFEHLFQNSKRDKIDIKFDFIPKDLHISEFKSMDEKLQYASKLKAFLKDLKAEQRQEVSDLVYKTFDDVEIPKAMMNWDDVRLLSSKGHYIGSHSATHNMLGTMDNEEEVFYELQHSAQRIEQELGYFPKTISYPIGSYNKKTIELAKKAGYSIGLATKQDIFDPNKTNLFEVERIELYNEKWWKTKLRISNRLEEIKKVIRYR